VAISCESTTDMSDEGPGLSLSVRIQQVPEQRETKQNINDKKINTVRSGYDIVVIIIATIMRHIVYTCFYITYVSFIRKKVSGPYLKYSPYCRPCLTTKSLREYAAVSSCFPDPSRCQPILVANDLHYCCCTIGTGRGRCSSDLGVTSDLAAHTKTHIF